MNTRTKNILKDRIIPNPRHIEILDGDHYKLQDNCTIKLTIPESSTWAKATSEKLAKAFWDCKPSFIIVYDDVLGMTADAYQVEVTADHINIMSHDIQGLKYAFYSLRQLAEPERLVREHSYYILPQTVIKDQPGLPFRAVHLCWFPETQIWEIEKQIRLAAYYKMNYAVIESWGIFPFKCEPHFCWQDTSIPQEEFKRLVVLAAEMGITLIPQLNLLGHASWARGGGGKHSVLNIHPQYQSLYEPDGSCWCLSNPETRKLLSALVCELHDTFENPPFFHIGCDEAHSLASCSVCSEQNVAELLTEHILFFHNLLTKRGVKTMMWHDMLVDKDDPRWKGYVAHGSKHLGTSEIIKNLPSDILICDWEYEFPECPENKSRQWPISKFFKSRGFDVIVCPWLDEADIFSLGKMAHQEKLLGLLTTTWHKNAGSNMYSIYFRSAEISWNIDYQCYNESGNSNLIRHLRHIEADMKTADYEEFGMLYHYQVSPRRAQD